MSEPLSALNGASSATGIVQVRELPLQGMITLRGDMGAAALKKAVKAAVGLKMPALGEALSDEGKTVCRMSPDEVLLLCGYGEVAATLQAAQDALGDTHSLVVNVSDARAAFEVSGPFAREVMAKLCPVDLAPGRFEPGMFRRTRMAQVAAAFRMPAADTFHIICFRSQARYVFDVLRVAAQPGSEVNAF